MEPNPGYRNDNSIFNDRKKHGVLRTVYIYTWHFKNGFVNFIIKSLKLLVGKKKIITTTRKD